jgi:MFS family permease
VKTHRAIVVATLGTPQTIAWASSYYMPAILGAPIAAALHLPSSVFFGLFSGALLLSAVIGPSVGRLIDRYGGRVLLACSNLAIAAGLLIRCCGARHRRDGHRLDRARRRHRNGS